MSARTAALRAVAAAVAPDALGPVAAPADAVGGERLFQRCFDGAPTR